MFSGLKFPQNPTESKESSPFMNAGITYTATPVLINFSINSVPLDIRRVEFDQKKLSGISEKSGNWKYKQNGKKLLKKI